MNNEKGAQNQDQSNQHQLAPIQNPSQQCRRGNSNGTERGQGQNKSRGGPPGHNNNNNRYENYDQQGHPYHSYGNNQQYPQPQQQY